MDVEYEPNPENLDFAIVIRDSTQSVIEMSREPEMDALSLLDKNHDKVAIQIPSSAFNMEETSSEEDRISDHKNESHTPWKLRRAFTPAAIKDVNNHLSKMPSDFDILDENEIGDSARAEYTNMYVLSNSPMASNCNSDLEEDRKSVDYSIIRRKVKNAGYKKITIEDVERSLSKYYDNDDRAFTEMDVIMTYLKGVQLLYAQSKTTTQMKLYSILMLAIGTSMSLAIVAPFVKDTHWGFYLLSSGNAFITILIAMTRYLKLDHNMVGFSFMVKQYAKFENKLVFEDFAKSQRVTQNATVETNDESQHSFNDYSVNRIRVSEVDYPQINRNAMKVYSDAFEETDKNPCDKTHAVLLQNIEMQLTELREICNVSVPEEIIRLLPLIYNTNIFRFIKKMRQYKTNLIIRFRDIKNEIQYILHKWKVDAKSNIKSNSPRHEREQKRLLYLMEMKEKTKSDLLLCRSTYNQIDELFNKEIRYAETHQSCLCCARWFRRDYDFSKLNPVVRDYLKLVVPD